MNVTTIGLDLAKNVFQVHGVDAKGRMIFKKRLSRGKVLSFFANVPPCLVGMEACHPNLFRVKASSRCFPPPDK